MNIILFETKQSFLQKKWYFEFPYNKMFSVLPKTIANVLVAFRSFLAADLSFFRLIFSSFFVLFWCCFFPTLNTELKDLTMVSFFPFLWLLDSSAATVICCSPFDDEDWSFLTSASTGLFIVVETVLSPVWLQEVRMMDGTVCADEGRTLFSSGRCIWKMHFWKVFTYS